jgi:hypothetical protein
MGRFVDGSEILLTSPGSNSEIDCKKRSRKDGLQKAQW